MKIGVIGFGDLGRSLVTGFIKRGISQDNILICDKQERAVKKANRLGVNNTDMDSLIEKCDTILFAVQKEDFNRLNIDGEKFIGKTVISCMAKSKMADLHRIFPTQVIRAVPTLAAENGVSIVGMCFDENTENKEEYKNLFSKVGVVLECKEEEMPALTALAACGLAYSAYILNSFINSAENLGFDRELGRKIVEKTFRAAMEMGDYELLIGKIAGRGGVTIKGMNSMNDANVHKSIDIAFKTAYGEFLK